MIDVRLLTMTHFATGYYQCNTCLCQVMHHAERSTNRQQAVLRHTRFRARQLVAYDGNT